MGCEYCSMSYNVKICQNQQSMCICCEGDPQHPSAYYRLWASQCVRVHLLPYPHDILHTQNRHIQHLLSCCNTQTWGKSGSELSKKKKTQTFAPLHIKCILWSSFTNLSLCIRTHKHVCEITLHSVSHSPYYSTLPPTHKKCAKRHSHTNKTHTGFSCERWL